MVLASGSTLTQSGRIVSVGSEDSSVTIIRRLPNRSYLVGPPQHDFGYQALEFALAEGAGEIRTIKRLGGVYMPAAQRYSANTIVVICA